MRAQAQGWDRRIDFQFLPASVHPRADLGATDEQVWYCALLFAFFLELITKKRQIQLEQWPISIDGSLIWQ